MLTRLLPSFALAIAVVGTSDPAVGACGADSSHICAAGSLWYQANNVRLKLQVPPGSDDYVQMVFSFLDPLNLRIEGEALQRGASDRTSIMLVGGLVVLTRGLPPERAQQMELLNVSLNFHQLVVILLSQAFPEGPDKFRDSRTVDMTEATRGIMITTGSVFAFYTTPWSLKGKLLRKNPETVDFSFTFEFPTDNIRGKVAFEGTWSKTSRAPVFDSNMSLDGWTAITRGSTTIKQEGALILDYGPQSKPGNLRTLGELQESLRRQEAPSSNPTADPDAHKSGARGSP